MVIKFLPNQESKAEHNEMDLLFNYLQQSYSAEGVCVNIITVSTRSDSRTPLRL